jgi:hypothetical protein
MALILAIAPITKFRWIKPFRNLFLRPRTDLVLNVFFSLAWIIVSIVVTTQALEQITCTHELINKSITQVKKKKKGYIMRAVTFIEILLILIDVHLV